MAKKARILFIGLPIESYIPDADTTIEMMAAARAAGHIVSFAEPKDLEIESGWPIAAFTGAEPAIRSRPRGRWRRRGKMRRRTLDDFDLIVVRTDPPFDQAYLHATQILDMAETLVINSPRGLRKANEKLYALRFPAWTPETIVTADRGRAAEFLHDLEEAVAKPLDSFGGIGVLRLSSKAEGSSSVIDYITAEGRRHALFQGYIPAARSGDKRVFVLGGEVIGVLGRRTPRGDFRANLHVGGRPRRAGLSRDERTIVKGVADAAMEDGLYFIGIDLVGGLLTEVNVTSPTGFAQYRALGGGDLGKVFIDWAVSSIGRLPSNTPRWRGSS